MIIKGANLGEVFAELKRISDYTWTNDTKLMVIVKKLENLYLNIKKQAQEQAVNSLPIDENGNVIIEMHAINHKCSNSLEILRSISNYGLLASEWFGVLESEREGCFCTFISRMKGENYPYRGDLAEDDQSRLNIGKNVILFFDDNHPLMKYLLHLDYFEFEYQKQINSDYRSLYTSDELEILEKLIEPLSPAGKGMRIKNYDFKTNYWSAIPGGIPSELVNGICVKNNDYSEGELDEISFLFPNAVIFNNNMKVLKYPFISYKTSYETKNSKL